MSLSKKVGDEGEQLVKELLSSWGIVCAKNTDYQSRYDYDFECSYKKRKFTIEIKWDKYAGKSHNLAIEVENSKSKTASGVSVTKANLWIHIIGDDADIMVVNTNRLKQFIINTIPHRIIEYGGDTNARLYLYKFKDILPIFQPCTLKSLLQELDYK